MARGDVDFRDQWWDAVRTHHDVTRDRLLVALVISTHARRDGTRAVVPVDELKQSAGISDSTVRRRVHELYALGFLELVERGHRRGDGTRTANTYSLALPLTLVTEGEASSTAHPEDRKSQVSTGQTAVSTGQNAVSTGHPGERPLPDPSLFPPEERRPRTESPGQRSHRLARIYTDLIGPLSNIHAVAKVLEKALTKYDDETLTAALQRLAGDNRSVTTETLRIELTGGARSSSHQTFRNPADPSTAYNGLRTARGRGAALHDLSGQDYSNVRL